MKKVTAVYFSPTGGTKKYVRAIAEKLSSEPQFIDLTDPQTRGKQYSFGKDDLVIFGAPVYAGRLPMIEGGIFDNFQGSNTAAVFTVSYGNREFDDALLEEKDILEARGFKGVAASGWIAPHTFSDRIAAGRPDAQDLQAVNTFAEQIKEILQKDDPGVLSVPGNRPYKDAKPMTLAPQATEDCIACGLCAKVCPTGVIDKEDVKKSDASRCIACLACVKKCPKHARTAENPALDAIRTKLEAALSAVHKEPQTFFAE